MPKIRESEIQTDVYIRKVEKLSILTLHDQAQVIDSTFYSIYIFQLLKFTCMISSRKQFSGEK